MVALDFFDFDEEEASSLLLSCLGGNSVAARVSHFFSLSFVGDDDFVDVGDDAFGLAS